MQLIPRHSERNVLEALRDTRVVAVTGPRQSGKTTLARRIADSAPRADFVSLDDATTLAAAQADPATFIADRRDLVVIDEVQRAPDLLVAIKASVDLDQAPGRFLITGSADLLSIRGLAETLAGRIELIDLAPFSQGELEQRRERFVDAALAAELDTQMEVQLSRIDYMRRACTGGFPEVVRRQSEDRRRRWFDSYLKTVAERETKSIVEIERIRDLPRVVRLIAARTGAPLNVAALARDSSIPERTVHRYLDVLESVFLIDRVRSWSPNLTSREARQPKAYIVDSGLGAHLRGATAARLARPETARGEEGPLLEGFVAQELRRQIGWSRDPAELMHYRDRDGREVDLVVETFDGRIVGIEVKSSATVHEGDFGSLEFLRDRLGSRFVAGFVLYTGTRGRPFGQRLAALPVGALWRHPHLPH